MNDCQCPYCKNVLTIKSVPEEKFCEHSWISYPPNPQLFCQFCHIPKLPEKLVESGLSYKQQDIEIVSKINEIIQYLRENKC